MALAGAGVADGDEIGPGLDPIACGQRLDAGSGHAGQRLEVECCERLAAGQFGLLQVTLDAAGVPIGEFDLGEGGEEARRGPALGIGTLGEHRPVALDAGQAQGREHGGQRMHVDGAGGGGGGHARLQEIVEAGQIGEGDGRVVRQFAPARFQLALEDAGLGQVALTEVCRDQGGKFGLAALLMGQPQQIDHAAAGVTARQGCGQRSPGLAVLHAGEQAVAVDGPGESLRLAAQRVDDMAVVDAVDAGAVRASATAGMGDDRGCAEESLNPVVKDMDPKALADKLRGRRVEDLMDQKASGSGDPRDHLGEVGRAPDRQRA